VLAIVVDLCGFPIALPFFVRLYRSEETCSPGAFRTRHEMLLEGLHWLKEWVSLPIELIADGAYFNHSVIVPLRQMKIPFCGRLRRDAALYSDPLKVDLHRKGRPPKYGPRLPSLPQMSRSGGWRFQQVHVYRKNVSVKFKVIDAWWPACSQKIRLVIIRNVVGRPRVTFLATTDLERSAKEVIEWYARRWSIEQLFSDLKLHLGLDSAEVRRPQSVVRHAWFTLACATWIQVWHYRRNAESTVHRSLCAKLRQLRSSLLEQVLFAHTARMPGLPRNSNPIADLFARALTAA
jgi:hypothetical protein